MFPLRLLLHRAAHSVKKAGTEADPALPSTVDVGINGEPVARTLATAIVQESYFTSPRGRATSGNAQTALGTAATLASAGAFSPGPLANEGDCRGAEPDFFLRYT